MKVILLKEIENLGDAGDIVSVKNGYGRNFLIPKGLARLATPSAIKHQEELTRQAAHKVARKVGDAQALADALGKEEIVVTARVGEENRIFGTITAQQIADKLAERGLQVDRRKIVLDEDIRMLGVYGAAVKLHPDVEARLKIRVEAEEAVES